MTHNLAGVPSRRMRARRRTIRGPDGFSLIEALVATGIFVSGAMGVVQLLTMAVAANAAARRHTDAAILASQKVEELLAMPWGTETAGGEDTDGCHRQWSATPLPATPADALVLDVRVACPGIADEHLVAVKTRGAP